MITMSPSMTRYRQSQPSKWVIISIVLGIIFFAIGFVAICVLLRVYRLSGKHKTTDSDHQETPMMNENHGENSSDQHGYTNGHSKKKPDDEV